MDQELLKKKCELDTFGIATSLSIPPSLKLPFKSEKAGYMICYTHDLGTAAKIQKQLVYMCEWYKIPLESKFNAGHSVKLQMENFEFSALNDVASIDALVSIYRQVRKLICDVKHFN